MAIGRLFGTWRSFSGEQWDIVERAIARATKPRDPDNPNRSPQGNALAAICAEYLGRVA
jgi:hypothetical protein